jgi:hypothetical protein
MADAPLCRMQNSYWMVALVASFKIKEALINRLFNFKNAATSNWHYCILECFDTMYLLLFDIDSVLHFGINNMHRHSPVDMLPSKLWDQFDHPESFSFLLYLTVS